MKILMINYEFPPLGGGGGVACYQLSKELSKNNHVDYITTAFKGLPVFEVVDGINVYRVPVPGRKDLSTATLLSMLFFVPSSLAMGIRLCRKSRYDSISAHFVVPSGLTGILLSILFGIPVTTSVYGGDIYDPSKRSSPHRHFFARKLISWLLNRSDGIVAESSNIKGLTERYYMPVRDVKIIPVGFQEPVFTPVSRESLGFSSEDLIIISVGRLVKRKGFDLAIQAIAELPYDNIKYLIVGDGPEENSLRDLVEKLKIDDRVKFLGYQPEDKKFQYLDCADIYLLSSIHEGFGICLMEAMYSGLPIVATDDGGQADLLKEGINTLFVPSANIKELAVKINDLINDKSLRKKMGENNKRDIRQYSISRVASDYLDVLSKAR
jgi:L-malate glycosyltransferase